SGYASWLREDEIREEGLVRLGLSGTCGCALCRRERGGELLVSDLLDVLKHFKDGEMYEDAVTVCDEILELDRRNLEVLLERARNLIEASSCTAAVASAEEYVSKSGGWTTQRHYKVPTTDVQVYKVKGILDWLNAALESVIFPALYSSFRDLIGGRRLRVFDAFFVKYCFDSGQRRLPLHNDQSLISLTIAMNPRSSFVGGGTWFMETGEACLTDIGGVTAFRGELEHRGEGIGGGVRYIVAAFLYAEDYK
ncbi:hypothetical protein TrRE_jg3040, partial [Triparma retinervis]